MRLFKKKRTLVHVVPSNQDWHILVDGTPLKHGAFPSPKIDAIKAAQCVAEVLEPSELFVLSRDGQISERDTYPRSSDPRDIKG